MKNIAFAAIGLTALALSACASRYDDGYYDRYGYSSQLSRRYLWRSRPRRRSQSL